MRGANLSQTLFSGVNVFLRYSDNDVVHDSLQLLLSSTSSSSGRWSVMKITDALRYIHPHAPMAARKLGIRGIVKSIWHSLRQTNRPESMLVHPNVIMDISPGAKLNLDERLLLGFIGETSASHPELMKSKFFLDENATLSVSRGTARIGPCSVLHIEGDFTIGNSYINSHAKILCEDQITIGDNCAIAWHVELSDSDMHSYAIDGEEVPHQAPINIGDGVWIGSNVQVKKGVTIGDGAVVASGSVVTTDVKSGTLVAGIPAQQVRDDIERLD